MPLLWKMTACLLLISFVFAKAMLERYRDEEKSNADRWDAY